MRDKLATFMEGSGFMGMLIGGSAIDGPGNDERVVAAIILISALISWIGSKLDTCDYDQEYLEEWEEGDDQDVF